MSAHTERKKPSGESCNTGLRLDQIRQEGVLILRYYLLPKLSSEHNIYGFVCLADISSGVVQSGTLDITVQFSDFGRLSSID